MPNIGIGKQAVLEKLARDVIPYGARIGAPGFCRNITTAPTIVPAVTQFVASLAGPQREWNHAFNYLEYSALQWLAQLMGLDPKIYQGIFSDGGSSANLICLIAARQAAFEKLGIDPAMDGVAGIPRPTLYTSDQVTGVLHRQVAIMGFGRRALVTVPSNEDFRLDVEALRERIHADIAEGCMPIAVVATAGTTNSGAIDPLADIAELCHQYQLWFHVDGAYGLPAIVDKRVASLYAGLEYADSLVLDPHKWFAIPVGCGAAFVRNKQILPRAFALGPAPFLVLEKPVGDEDDEEQFEMQSITSPFATWGKEYGDRGNASSAPSRGISVWALFQEIGIEGLRERISRHITFARDLAWLIEQSECLQNMGSNSTPIINLLVALPSSRMAGA